MVTIEELLPIFKERMRLFALILKNTPELIDRGFIINSGAWANPSGFCVAFLSCARSPQDISIELTFVISSGEGDVSLGAGIYFSDGSLIQDFGTISVPGCSFEELQIGIEGYFDQIRTNELGVFVDFLKQQYLDRI